MPHVRAAQHHRGVALLVLVAGGLVLAARAAQPAPTPDTPIQPAQAVAAAPAPVAEAQPELPRAFIDGTGPVFSGTLFPFCFITIACGALSGFHSLISSGTTPKLIDKETDARFVGYGAMLMESFVGIMALMAAVVMDPGVYFAINSPAAIIGTTAESAARVISGWGYALDPLHLTQLTREIGESTLLSRTGGAPSLAVGMAEIFAQVLGGAGVKAVWYHFAIMFEALFILTTVDAGTRVARFMMQELLGGLHAKFAQTDWTPGAIVAGVLAVVPWTYLILTGSIATIWPLFGMANQMLACVALCVGTTFLINAGRARYAWVTMLPLSFLIVIELTAGYQNLTLNYLPKGLYLNAGITISLMIGLAIVVFGSALKWYRVAIKGEPHRPAITQPATT